MGQRADLRQRHDDRVLVEVGGEVVLRPATAADALPIARLHVQVWRATYRELAPPEAYHKLDVALRLSRWEKILADPVGLRSTLVATRDDAIVGLGHCCAATEPIFGARGEIRSLYIDPACGRQGVGRRLMAALAVILRGEGYAGAALGVVVGNTPAIAFYDRLGGRVLGGYRDSGPTWFSDNLAYAWDDLTALITR